MKDHKIKAEINGAGQHRYSLKEIDSADNNAGEIQEEHLTDGDGRRGLSNIGTYRGYKHGICSGQIDDEGYGGGNDLGQSRKTRTVWDKPIP